MTDGDGDVAVTMRYTAMHDTAEGGSCFADVEVELTRGSGAQRPSRALTAPPLPGTVARFAALADGVTVLPAHAAPRRQVVVILEGAAEIETSDGRVRRFGRGDVVVALDTDGAGHVLRVLEPPLRLLLIPISSEDT